jgi:hypothetical protein
MIDYTVISEGGPVGSQMDTFLGLTITSWYRRVVVREGSGYSIRIWREKGLRLAL